MSTQTSDYTTRLTEILSAVNDSSFIKSARDVVSNNIKDFAFSDEKKGELYINFENALVQGALANAFTAAMDLPVKKAQTLQAIMSATAEQKRAALLGQQKITEDENTKKVTEEIQFVKEQTSAIKNKDKRDSDRQIKDLEYIDAQIELVNAQASAATAETTIKNTQSPEQINLLKAQTGLANAQKAQFNLYGIVKASEHMSAIGAMSYAGGTDLQQDWWTKFYNLQTSLTTNTGA